MNTTIVLGVTLGTVFGIIVAILLIPHIKMKRRGHRLRQQYMSRLRETV